MEWKQFPCAEEQNKRIAELEAENDMLKCAAFDQADQRETTEAENERLREEITRLRAKLTVYAPDALEG